MKERRQKEVTERGPEIRTVFGQTVHPSRTPVNPTNFESDEDSIAHFSASKNDNNSNTTKNNINSNNNSRSSSSNSNNNNNNNSNSNSNNNNNNNLPSFGVS